MLLDRSIVKHLQHDFVGPESAATRDGQMGCILLVDDDIESRTVLKWVLQGADFKVLEAGDGMDAIRLYEAQYRAITIVVLGVRMQGLPAAETLKVLRQINPDVCCCFMGGNLGSFSMAALQQLKPAASFVKPFDMAEIVAFLSDLAHSVQTSIPGMQVKSPELMSDC